MANIVYNMDGETVDPVFFAVVPDSFMTERFGVTTDVRDWGRAEDWSEEEDQPLLSPHDRWSF
ncbi:MAG: hypothetical protein HWD60_06500 [Defluviicoccus sp.]|nr:MAG: hypothetical protein HWD60_06500 [Defluviicoccus sp.]